MASDPEFENIIAKAKKETDFLITSFHWGEEYQKATQRQKNLAHQAIEAGANIVVGHHPHVVQETENYQDGLIIYSLGNLVFDQYFSEATMQGLVIKIILESNKISKIDKKLIKLARNYQPIELVDYSPDVLSLKANPNRDKAPGSTSDCPKPKPDTEMKDLWQFNVNQENSLEDYVPENLVSLSKNITNGLPFCLESKASQALRQMLKSAQSDNLILAVTSAYRSFETQENLFNSGENKNDGEYPLIAQSKHSEHQLGTVVDLSGQSINYQKTRFEFENSPEYTWLKNNADRFGFIQSYPKDKEAITGYQAEPWHWRYIGIEIAQKIKESGQTLGEFLGK
ncbi:D-alanyl-D-alanine carboxypeptidase family protein [Candidatus Azambacteria bacterium]|nr:D-alanyl-D-alanine carboxypeptidase family protein [Candidatus Azambacteria bacterium]